MEADSCSRVAWPSARALSVWAKSSRDGRWLTLPQHLLDTMGVGDLLFREWLAPAIRRQWGAVFPAGETDALAMFRFSCATHDVGKASPSFACQVKTLAERMSTAGLVSKPFEVLRVVRQERPHSVVSDWALRSWLAGRGVDQEFAAQVSSIAGAHHGRAAARRLVLAAGDSRKAVGDSAWGTVREELISFASAASGTDERWAAWGQVRLPLHVQVGMTGLLIMADWIASNEAYFPLSQLQDEPAAPMAGDQLERCRAGWEAIQLASPWLPEVPDLDVEDLFRERFRWPAEWAANPVQRHVAELAHEEPPGLMIVESPMGSGKTEAALVAAEVLAARVGAHGLLVTLPTQATTNAMFDRVVDWLEALPTPMEQVIPWSLVLGHGKAFLNPRYAQMVEMARAADLEAQNEIGHIHDDESDTAPEPEGDEGAWAMAHQWFNGAKRRLLNNFAVTTIDQLLLVGTQRKHQMLNHLALAGKVVVIDEAHASDSYMNVFLDAVLPWLGAYGTPVVVLSATLTPARRRSLVAAYRGRLTTPAEDALLSDERYPLVTCAAGEEMSVSHQPLDTRPLEIQWQWGPATDDYLAEVISETFADEREGCVLIVRNTVTDAQRTYDRLRGGNVRVTLHHSRFLANDRAASDARLVERFGRGGERPARHVVVATQVVEQSLDVDFDLLVTDLAPMDLLFQRLGRLHRHSRSRPDHLTSPRVVVLRDPDRSDIPCGSRGSRIVYGDHWLLRTAAALEAHGQKLRLPHDIAPLVSLALGDHPLGTESWQEDMVSAQAKARTEDQLKQQRARVYALPAEDTEPDATMAEWFTTSYGSTDEKVAAALVRDTEPSVEVLMVIMNPDGQVIRPPWLTEGVEEVLDVRVKLDTSPNCIRRVSEDGHGIVAHEVASWTITLPPSLTRRPEHIDKLLQILEGQHAPRTWAWLEHPLLARQLVLVMHQVEEGSTTVESSLFEGLPGGGLLRYSPERGMEVVEDV